MKKISVIITVSVLFSASFTVTAIGTQANASAEQTENVAFSQAQLMQILSPIALYPDTLLTHILIASTYPLELVKVKQWQEKNTNPSAKKLEKASDNKDWEPSVKALLPFPQVVQRLVEDLDWTQQLGEAFLADEEQVLAAIQSLRHKAEQAGSLSQMDNVEISYDQRNIVIQPTRREVVYVPYYDTRVVYGYWHWSHYPPIYWARPHYYVRHGYRPFYWHHGVHISVNYFFGAFHWRNRHVVVINNYNTHRPIKPRKIIGSHGAKRWQHKPVHRRGVHYRNQYAKARVHKNRHVSAKTQPIARSQKHAKHYAKSANQQRVKNRAYEVTKQPMHKYRGNSAPNKSYGDKNNVVKHSVAKKGSAAKHSQFKAKLAQQKHVPSTKKQGAKYADKRYGSNDYKGRKSVNLSKHSSDKNRSKSYQAKLNKDNAYKAKPSQGKSNQRSESYQKGSTNTYAKNAASNKHNSYSKKQSYQTSQPRQYKANSSSRNRQHVASHSRSRSSTSSRASSGRSGHKER